MPSGSSIEKFITEKNQLTQTSEYILSISLYAGKGVKAKSYLEHFREIFCHIHPETLKSLVTSLFMFAGCLILPVHIFRKISEVTQTRQEKYKILFLFLSALSPLGLCVIGIDFGRWCSTAMWCFFLSEFSLFSLYNDREIRIPRDMLTFQILLFVFFYACTDSCTEITFCQLK